MTFSQFCGAAPSAYTALRRCVDTLSQQGRGYEVPDCGMPEGCVPDHAVLGFLRQGSGYLLYWRPAVAYHGQNRVLAALFARSVWCFDSFEALAGRLLSLRREVEPAKAIVQPYQPPPLTPEPPKKESRWPSFTAEPPQKESLWPPLYRRLQTELGQAVLGQERAVEGAAFRLFSHAGKRTPARPLSLIFYGPTGVGKSELGKSIAPALERCFARRYQFVWTELNTFTQPHSVHRLTGAPPGYVGYEDTPVFEAVRQNPFTVFMFDELEKAHPEVLKVFMSILDEGRCTAHRADAQNGRELDFRRCVFVFTTNADLSSSSSRPLGFSDERHHASPLPAEEKTADSPAELAERLFQENETARRAMVRQGVLKEIAGRFSGLIGFHALDQAARRAITVKQIRALAVEYGLQITQVDPDTAQALAPGEDALSIRSSVCVLEGLLAPLLSTAAGGRPYRLEGVPGSLRLLPAHSSISNSSTELFSRSYL